MDKETSHETKSAGNSIHVSTITSLTLSPLETAFCGATAGVVSRFVIAPLDVVKIRLQLQTHRPSFSIISFRGEVKRNIETAPKKYTGMIQGMAVIAKEEGITGLWKGNLPAEYFYLTYSAIQFYAYQRTENSLAKTSIPYPAIAFISGATAGSIAMVMTYPLDLLRTRFVAQGKDKIYMGVFQAFRYIYKQDGIRGFFQGIVPSAVQIVPYMGLMFGSYDALRRTSKWFKERHIFLQTPFSESIICGALAGIISKTGVFPFDVIRKRLQVQGLRQESAPKYTDSIFTMTRKILRQEGFFAFYKGIVPGLVKAAPASAVTFFVYGKTKELVEAYKTSTT